eukprot:scaffold18171_cov42-Cyclotella_meneghiniana.AAC.1
MDLTITIKKDRIITTLYEKALNLYLYIPPFSSHPRGIFTGTISGQILRIRRLCTYKSDADSRIQEFLSRLLARGHLCENLEPLFSKAEENATAYLLRSPKEHRDLRKRKRNDSHHQVYFHLRISIRMTLHPVKFKSCGGTMSQNQLGIVLFPR